MGDYGFTVTNHDVQNHIAAAAQHIMMALKACRNLTDENLKVLSVLNSYLPSNLVNEGTGGMLMDMEEQITQSEGVIMRWESCPKMIWESGLAQASEYLDAVVEIQKIVGAIGGVHVPTNGKRRELALRAHCILQIAMSKLEEELTHILIQHKQCYMPEYMSFRSCLEDAMYDESFVSAEEDTLESTSRGDNPGSSSDQCLVDLVQPEVVSAVKLIADVMFASNHGKEFFGAFVAARRDALDEYLVVLKMEQFTIEDILKMDWKVLSCEIKKWVWALRIVVRVYLRSEKWLCNQILGEHGTTSWIHSFTEIAEAAMLQFLNFGEAIAMGPRQPERLFRVLDMYEVLSDLLVDIDAIFIENAGSFIRTEFHELLPRLADYAKGAFAEFRNCIASDQPRKAFSSGVHPFANYAMNYIKLLTAYRETLDLLLHDSVEDGMDPSPEPENVEETHSCSSCPLARHARLLASVLQANLEIRSKLLKNESLQHIFLMNNIHYMVKKIKDSDLRQYFGDEWIRKQIGAYQHHATSYMRATWSSTLSLLIDSRNGRLELNPFSRSSPRERCRNFTAAFEEVYKNQTGWLVPDLELREDLQISTSQKVIPAYRSFLGKNSSQIGEKYIKYSIGDLESLVLDFFGGSSRSLRSRSSRRK